MADFLMPALGADMETGKLVEWRVAAGSRVKPGDVVAVVETHKGAIDVEIFLDGVIEDLVPLGTELPVGGVLARVREAAGAPAPAVAPAPSPAP
ncbi:biotin/lipoyl-containing protein, partial [Ramlibacter sp.]|uniref:biotin/lipoyl-containing protein n=1 Tax=Ramlibacter sp. TaxID=1917967 RepID=UPI002FC83F96